MAPHVRDTNRPRVFVALAPSSDADTAHVAEGEADALALVHQRPPRLPNDPSGNRRFVGRAHMDGASQSTMGRGGFPLPAPLASVAYTATS